MHQLRFWLREPSFILDQAALEIVLKEEESDRYSKKNKKTERGKVNLKQIIRVFKKYEKGVFPPLIELLEHEYQ